MHKVSIAHYLYELVGPAPRTCLVGRMKAALSKRTYTCIFEDDDGECFVCEHFNAALLLEHMPQKELERICCELTNPNLASPAKTKKSARRRASQETGRFSRAKVRLSLAREISTRPAFFPFIAPHSYRIRKYLKFLDDISYRRVCFEKIVETDRMYEVWLIDQKTRLFENYAYLLEIPDMMLAQKADELDEYLHDHQEFLNDALGQIAALVTQCANVSNSPDGHSSELETIFRIVTLS